MSKKIRDDEPAFGSDSFLDIVANMVGILIILVMVAGLRARDVSHLEPQPTAEEAQAVSELESQAQQLDGENRELSRQLRATAITLAGRQQERDSLLLLVSQGKELLDEESRKLDTRSQEEMKLRNLVSQREAEFEKLSQELRQAAVQTSDNVVKVDNYPTPISRTVHGNEIHFQLRDQRISYVPIEELIEVLKRDAPRRVNRLQEAAEVTETIGPIGGFRMRYTLARVPINGGFSVHLAQFIMLPLVDELGETLDEIKRPESLFHGALGRANPRNTTVTLWVYPESFATYHAVRRELHTLGFAVAGRPLNAGMPIGGSPQGTKSAAE